MAEARINGDKIMFNGWFKMLVGALTTIMIGTTAYAFVIVMPAMANNMIENDKLSRDRDHAIEIKVYDNRVLIESLASIKKDIDYIRKRMDDGRPRAGTY